MNSSLRQTQVRTGARAGETLLPVSILQRHCDCGQHTIAGGECDECGKKHLSLQRASRNSGLGTRNSGGATPIVHEVLHSPGQPLDAATRAFFEPRFGHDFSRVRVHVDGSATQSARAVKALAYTVGNDVVFGAGRYAPTTSAGRTLLAHELTHVVQQSNSQRPALQKASEGTETGAAEEEARTAANTVAAGEEATPADTGEKKKTPASCTRTIFSEGTCAFLVANSRFICCDPVNGIERKGRKTDIDGNPCPSEKFTPIFTCDSKCGKALTKGCDDNDNWMAVPNNQFTRSQCGDIWTICANGKSTTGYVRDHSVTQTRFEVSPKIQNDLGVTVGSSFKGAIYRPGAKQSAIDKDTCCNS